SRVASEAGACARNTSRAPWEKCSSRSCRRNGDRRWRSHKKADRIRRARCRTRQRAPKFALQACLPRGPHCRLLTPVRTTDSVEQNPKAIDRSCNAPSSSCPYSIGTGNLTTSPGDEFVDHRSRTSQVATARISRYSLSHAFEADICEPRDRSLG